MAHKPDLDDGWLMLAHGLLPALLAAPLRLEARLVLAEVLAQVYGAQKAPQATLDVAALARRWGLDRPNVWRGLRELTAAGILVRAPGPARGPCLVTFSKSALIAYLPQAIARGLDDYVVQARRKRAPDSVPGDTSMVSCGTLQGPAYSVPGDTSMVSCGTLISPPPPKTPSCSEEERRNDDDGGRGRVAVAAHAREIPQDLTALAAEVLGPGPHAHLSAWMDSSYPPAWIRDALLASVECPTIPRRGAYASACLRRWSRAGGPPPDQPGIQAQARPGSNGSHPPAYRLTQAEIRMKAIQAGIVARFTPKPEPTPETPEAHP